MKTQRQLKTGVLALIALLLCSEFTLAATATLLEDSGIADSTADCDGIAAALHEVRIASTRIDLAAADLSALEFETPVVIACHLDVAVDQAGIARLTEWVDQGGGLLATGQSARGLESLLGLHSISLVSGSAFTEVRFDTGHPFTYGIGWNGAITTSPPLPIPELPSIVRHLYDIDEPGTDRWPSYIPSAEVAEVIGYWRNMEDPWTADDTAAAVTVQTHGQGRAIYSGALPGIYDVWDWPRSWRTVVVNAVEWLGRSEPVVELGFWPHGHAGALSWSGDTEKPAMVTAVPKLLNLFNELGLENFGTFYIVGKAGGDGDTLGAQEHPEVVAEILTAGAEVGGHSDVHSTLFENDKATQRQRLGDMLNIINPMIAPKQVRGFRAPYLSQNRHTWDVLRELGIDHDAGDADVWSQATLPFMLGDLVQLPPTMPMDWHLFEEHGLSDQLAEQIWQDKLEYILARRGLFSWLHHPWVIEDHLGVVENVLSGASERGDVWMARQDDVARWWRQRLAVELEPLTATSEALEIEVRNSGSTMVEGVSIWIRVPAGEMEPWVAKLDCGRVPLLQRDHGQARFRVAVVDRMEAGESRRLRIIRKDRIFQDSFGC